MRGQGCMAVAVALLPVLIFPTSAKRASYGLQPRPIDASARQPPAPSFTDPPFAPCPARPLAGIHNSTPSLSNLKPRSSRVLLKPPGLPAQLLSPQAPPRWPLVHTTFPQRPIQPCRPSPRCPLTQSRPCLA